MPAKIRFVDQVHSWGCAVACAASLVGMTYTRTLTALQDEFPDDDLTEGLDANQLRRFLTGRGLILSRLHNTDSWNAVRAAVQRRRHRAIGALVATG